MVKYIRINEADGYSNIFLESKKLLDDETKAAAVGIQLTSGGLELITDNESVVLNVVTEREPNPVLKVYAHRGNIYGIRLPRNSSLAVEALQEKARLRPLLPNGQPLPIVDINYAL